MNSARPRSPETAAIPPTQPSATRPPGRPPLERPCGVALDIQGTLLDPNSRPLPGAIQTIESLREAEIPFVLASNQTTTDRRQLAASLRASGFDILDEDVLTTAFLTEKFLNEKFPGARIALYADGNPISDPDLNLVADHPDVVVLAGAGPWLCHKTLNTILRQLDRGAKLVAMHGGLLWMSATGLALDIGALLPGLEAATGRPAHVIGKPAAAFFEQTLLSKGIAMEGSLMVGDDIEADVLASQRLGITGVLVRTGKYRGDFPQGKTERPDHVIDSIAELPRLLKIGGGVR